MLRRAFLIVTALLMPLAWAGSDTVEDRAGDERTVLAAYARPDRSGATPGQGLWAPAPLEAGCADPSVDLRMVSVSSDSENLRLQLSVTDITAAFACSGVSPTSTLHHHTTLVLYTNDTSVYSLVVKLEREPPSMSGRECLYIVFRGGAQHTSCAEGTFEGSTWSTTHSLVGHLNKKGVPIYDLRGDLAEGYTCAITTDLPLDGPDDSMAGAYRFTSDCSPGLTVEL